MPMNFMQAVFLSNLPRVMILVVLILLGGCGFQLRGAYSLPPAMASTYIDASFQSELADDLREGLERRDIQVKTKHVANAAILKLQDEQQDRRVIAVDSRGRAVAYTLISRVRFSVKNAEAGFSMDEQEVGVERDFHFDPEDVLGNSRGQLELYDDMRKDLVRLILLRLQTGTAQ